MADILSWGWYSGTKWPGFSLNNQNNLGTNGNGLSISPSSYTEMIQRDANDDGILSDADLGDGSTNTVDRVVIGPTARTVHEIAAYTNSTIMVDGVTYTDRLLGVALFTDGTYAVRPLDSSIPEGHYKKVTQITLGSFNGVEYNGNSIASFTAPFICFAAGTRIATPDGERRVECLRPGDLVLTVDHGAQPILWTGHRLVCGTGALAPIRFAPGVMGNARALKLSPQHRVLIRCPPGSRTAGQEVLVAGRHLLDAGRIRPAPRPQVSYHHVLLARHELLWAEGVAVESLLPTPYSLSLLTPKQRQEILRLRPALWFDPIAFGPPARPFLTGREVRNLRRARHLAGPEISAA